MRQRSSGEQPNEANAQILSKLRRFDVYAKVHEEYNVQTWSGGLISVISFFVMVLLFLSEFVNYMNVEVIDHIIVDTTVNQKLPIGMNITFPHLRCDEVSVDTVDSMMENQINIQGTLTKVNLDINGEFTEGDPEPKPDDCLDCLEAKNIENPECCNTCTDLKMAYINAGLPYFHILDTAPQCRMSVGCQVFGDVLVSKVGGNVHVALGKSMVREGKHVHEFNVREISDGFNTSHIIHRLEFGERVAGLIFPLEGTQKIVKHGAFMFHYYIKLVPTLYETSTRTIYTHQYAVTESEKNVQLSRDELAGLPGVFLVYEFTPFMVQKIEKIVPLSHFFTSICAIIGGVFSVAGMMDAILYKTYKKMRRATTKDT